MKARVARPLRRLVMPWVGLAIAAAGVAFAFWKLHPVTATISCCTGMALGHTAHIVEMWWRESRALRFMCATAGLNVREVVDSAERVSKDDRLTEECERRHNHKDGEQMSDNNKSDQKPTA